MVEEPEWPFRTWDEEQEAFQENLDHAGPPRSAQNPELLVVPLVKGQDAVARFEASVAAAPHDVAYGLRTRMALFEAAGFLAHHGSVVHPHDLALREAGLTGSYSIAAMTGRLKAVAPWTTTEGGEEVVIDDHLVANALAFARQWRRLAELSSWQPLKSVEVLSSPLTQLGAHLADDEATRLAFRFFHKSRLDRASPPIHRS